jgi:hypothetical protein
MLKISLIDELAEVRAEIARLRKREEKLTALADSRPLIPVFRRAGWPIRRDPAHELAHG